MPDSSKPDVHGSPLGRARHYSDLHLQGKALPAEARWLRAYPVLWLRVLTMTEREVKSHMAKDRLSLSKFKPKPGEAVRDHQWIPIKAEADDRHKNRLHFLERVNAHKQEAKSLTGIDPVSGLGNSMIGDLVEQWVDLAEMIEEGDYSAARDFANHWAEKWSKYQRQRSREDEAMEAIRQKWGTNT